MFTSRAEYRLLLRQDNADLRLRGYGYELGLVNRTRYDKVVEKQQRIDDEAKRLLNTFRQIDGKGYSLAQLLCRPENSYSNMLVAFPEAILDHGDEINFQIELTLKYAGYIDRQNSDIEKLRHIENIKVPASFDYTTVVGLRTEA